MPAANAIRPSTRRARRALLALVIAAAFGTVIGWWHGAWATPPAPGTAVGAQPVAPAPDASVSGTAPPAAPIDPTKVTITFSTVPPAHATVTWGRTRLGRTPLVVVRPRDSGPLDVVVRAAGFLPVQTRAQTFADCRVQVKLTRADQKATLLGYREPIDAGPSLMGDAGVTESFSGTVPGTAPPVAAPTSTPVPAPQVQPKPVPAPAPAAQAQPKPVPAPAPVAH